ncbi:MAG TPA: TolC family protein [Burkholderiales bacterium]|nr:TolC family protein [Burkholderiales bacterium]
MRTHILRVRSGALAFAALLIGGCASFSSDGGFGTVETAVRERGLEQKLKWVRSERDAEDARAIVKKLLAAPLTADTAVQVALLNNRGLQATYAELGIAEADVVQAGRLTNPGFTFERLQRGDEVSIERTFLFDILGLITMPVRTDLERRRFALVQNRIAAETLRAAADTRRAWSGAVAANETARYMEQVKAAAEATAELARRMAAAGNFSKLDQARDQLFYAEATAQLARARQAALSERERLTRLMGLWGEDVSFRLPERLPELPKAGLELADLEAQAMKQRLDVQSAMKDAERIAASLGLTRATGFIDVLEVGYRHNSDSGEPRQTGYEIELRLPIFDWGGARVERAERNYMQAVDRAADTAVKARSEVREAYGAYRTAFDLAKHYRDEIVPLRKRISDENLLRYNGMLISIFELLADARQQVASVNAYIDALRDFWLAETALRLAMTATSPGSVTLAGSGMQPSGGKGAAAH